MNSNQAAINNIHERRAVMTDALVKALEIFCSHSETSFDAVIVNGLQPIAEAMKSDRIVVFRREEIDGEERMRFTHRWDMTEGAETDFSLGIIPIKEPFNTWLHVLEKDICVNQRISDMTEEQISLISTFGILSIFMAPVFTHGELWGVVVFEDHVNERLFDESCIDLMHSAGRMCVNAIIRAEMTQSAEEALKILKHKKLMMEAFNHVAVSFLSQRERSFEDMMEVGIRHIADIIPIDSLSIWRNFTRPDGLHTSQIYRWDEDVEVGLAHAERYSDVIYAKYAPNWERLFVYGGTVNGPVSLIHENETSMLLRNLGVMSVFAAPVIIDSYLWGFVLYGNSEKEFRYDDDSAELMNSAAFLFVNAVISREIEQIANGNNNSVIQPFTSEQYELLAKLNALPDEKKKEVWDILNNYII